MALINCPECNKEISDKAECCINCGYKLQKQETKFWGEYCPSCLSKGRIRTEKDDKNTTCPFCKISRKYFIYGTYDEVHSFCENHPELKESPEFSIEAYNKRINYVPVEYGNSSSNISSNNCIKCPYCQSTNTKKISVLSKATHTAMFGIFSISRNSKQFHCNNCSADF